MFAVRLEVIYDLPGNQQERGRLYVMPQPQSEAPCLYLERARDREGSSKTAWCTDYWRGSAWAGGGGGVKGVKYAPMPPGTYKKGKKQAALIIKILLLKALWSQAMPKIQKSYTPPAAQIMVKRFKCKDNKLKCVLNIVGN